MTGMGVKSKPGHVFSTTKAVTPRRVSGLVRANTMPQSPPQGTGYEDLASVDDPVVAIAYGAGLDSTGGVGAATGLGDGEP